MFRMNSRLIQKQTTKHWQRVCGETVGGAESQQITVRFRVITRESKYNITLQTATKLKDPTKETNTPKKRTRQQTYKTSQEEHRNKGWWSLVGSTIQIHRTNFTQDHTTKSWMVWQMGGNEFWRRVGKPNRDDEKNWQDKTTKHGSKIQNWTRITKDHRNSLVLLFIIKHLVKTFKTNSNDENNRGASSS